MMYSCNDCNDLLHAFLTLTCPSAYYMLYRNMSIYCNTLGAIYRYGKIQYRPSSTLYTSTHTHTCMQRVNEKPQVVNDYESGRAIPNQQIISKLERAVGVKLRGKDIGAPLGSKKK